MQGSGTTVTVPLPSLSRCHGNRPDHCCWLQGRVCPHLEEFTMPGRRWVCGLLRELGTWDAVLADVRHVALGSPPCDTWPQEGLRDRIARGNGLCCWETDD